MLPTDPLLARSQVLRDFNHAQIYLFLGAVIITIGLVPAFFSVMRRRYDPLLLWFSLFAVLYGIHLELDYQPLWALGVRPVFLVRIMVAVGFLLPIPGFFFFRMLNVMNTTGRLLSNLLWPVFFFLSLAAVLIGPRPLLAGIEQTIVVIALLVVMFALIRGGGGTSRIALVRIGFFVFIAGALYSDTIAARGKHFDVEPFTFLVLLACLGVVAGRRALASEQQLTSIQQELDIARSMQLSLLPAPFPASESFQVTARYLPMSSVAGDLYDFLITGEKEAGLLIADVSGHGVPAALISSMVKFAATQQRSAADQPSTLLLGMNNTLFGNTQSQFVTAGYLYLNASLEELRYSAAGHPPMLLVRDGEVTEIVENGLMLAAFSFATYTTLSLPIRAGDRFVLYTDGMLEATNSRLEEFGPERLYAVLRETAQLSQTAAADRLIAAIQQWAALQSDDLTVILCDYLG